MGASCDLLNMVSRASFWFTMTSDHNVGHWFATSLHREQTWITCSHEYFGTETESLSSDQVSCSDIARQQSPTMCWKISRISVGKREMREKVLACVFKRRSLDERSWICFSTSSRDSRSISDSNDMIYLVFEPIARMKNRNSTYDTHSSSSQTTIYRLRGSVQGRRCG